jgi:hypothetical protein
MKNEVRKELLETMKSLPADMPITIVSPSRPIVTTAEDIIELLNDAAGSTEAEREADAADAAGAATGA